MSDLMNWKTSTCFSCRLYITVVLQLSITNCLLRRWSLASFCRSLKYLRSLYYHKRIWNLLLTKLIWPIVIFLMFPLRAAFKEDKESIAPIWAFWRTTGITRNKLLRIISIISSSMISNWCCYFIWFWLLFIQDSFMDSYSRFKTS